MGGRKKGKGNGLFSCKNFLICPALLCHDKLCRLPLTEEVCRLPWRRRFPSCRTSFPMSSLNVWPPHCSRRRRSLPCRGLELSLYRNRSFPLPSATTSLTLLSGVTGWTFHFASCRLTYEAFTLPLMWQRLPCRLTATKLAVRDNVFPLPFAVTLRRQKLSSTRQVCPCLAVTCCSTVWPELPCRDFSVCSDGSFLAVPRQSFLWPFAATKFAATEAFPCCTATSFMYIGLCTFLND